MLIRGMGSRTLPFDSVTESKIHALASEESPPVAGAVRRHGVRSRVKPRLPGLGLSLPFTWPDVRDVIRPMAFYGSARSERTVSILEVAGDHLTGSASLPTQRERPAIAGC